MYVELQVISEGWLRGWVSPQIAISGMYVFSKNILGAWSPVYMQTHAKAHTRTETQTHAWMYYKGNSLKSLSREVRSHERSTVHKANATLHSGTSKPSAGATRARAARDRNVAVQRAHTYDVFRRPARLDTAIRIRVYIRGWRMASRGSHHGQCLSIVQIHILYCFHLISYIGIIRVLI